MKQQERLVQEEKAQKLQVKRKNYAPKRELKRKLKEEEAKDQRVIETEQTKVNVLKVLMEGK